MVLQVNSRLAAHCKYNGWLFVDKWDLFYCKDISYARESVHLPHRELKVLADSLERSLNTLQDSFRVGEVGGPYISDFASQTGTR